MTARSWLRAISWLLSVLLVGAGCFWAGRVVTREPSSTSTVAAESMDVTVATSSVGRSLTYNVTVTQARVPVAANLLTGVVTAVRRADSYANGDTVYAVDNRPVRVISGDTPFYRDLAAGDSGPDVAELNTALAAMGYSAGTADVFTAATRAGVMAWQRSLGIEQTGTLVRGEIVAVASLPRPLFLDDESLRPGMVLAGGEQLISTASGDPSFSLDLNSQQAQGVPTDATVTITYKDATWSAIITAQGLKQDATTGATVTSMTLAAPDGGVVCADSCDLLPASENLYIPATIEVVPSVSGPAVPVTALSSQPDGTTTVTLVSGGTTTQQTVTVMASVDGIAIVKGLTDGDVVRVYGAANGAAASTTGTSTTGPASPDPTSTSAASPSAASSSGAPASEAPAATGTGTGQ